MLKRYSGIFLAAFLSSDIVIIFCAWTISYLLAPGPVNAGHILRYGLWGHAGTFVLIVPVFLFSAYRSGFYEPRRFSYYLAEFGNTFKTVSYACVVFFFFAYITGWAEYGLPFTASFWGISIALIFAYHSSVNYLLKRSRLKGYNLRSALIVGSGELAMEAASKFLSRQEFGIKVIGSLSNKDDPAGNMPGCPIIGRYGEIKEVIRKWAPDIVFFAMSPEEERLTRSLVSKINDEQVDIKIALDIKGAFILRSGFTEIDGMPVISLRDRNMAGLQFLIKRSSDIVLSLAALVVLSPLFAVIAVLVKLSSPGPVFYIQERMGLDGKRFRLIKFRTMKDGAEKDVGPVWASEDDPRRTKAGAWLRRASLDELPQFINVLRGDMSVVGPRPERPEFIPELEKNYRGYHFRHIVRSGMTGWAQVHGLRGNTPIEKRLEYDMYYINNFSLWLDLRIMLLTIPAIFNGKGAC